MNKPTKLGAICGAAIAGLAAIPILFPMFFFFSADDQTLAGAIGAIFQCIVYGGVIVFGGALCGALIGGVIFLFMRRKYGDEGHT